MQNALNTAIEIHASACEKLADHVALVEEHFPASPSHDGRRISVAVLGARGRALRETRHKG